jgi:hypothetical protein
MHEYILCLKGFRILNIRPSQVLDWIAKFVYKNYLCVVIFIMKVRFTRFGKKIGARCYSSLL